MLELKYSIDEACAPFECLRPNPFPPFRDATYCPVDYPITLRDCFEALLKAFSGYALIHDWPKFWEQDSKKTGGDNGCPWPLAIVANLIASGIDEKRAWEMPECQAVWLHSVFSMRKGAELKIMTPEEEAFMAAEEAAAASTSAKEKTD